MKKCQFFHYFCYFTGFPKHHPDNTGRPLRNNRQQPQQRLVTEVEILRNGVLVGIGYVRSGSTVETTANINLLGDDIKIAFRDPRTGVRHICLPHAVTYSIQSLRNIRQPVNVIQVASPCILRDLFYGY